MLSSKSPAAQSRRCPCWVTSPSKYSITEKIQLCLLTWSAMLWKEITGNKSRFLIFLHQAIYFFRGKFLGFIQFNYKQDTYGEAWSQGRVQGKMWPNEIRLKLNHFQDIGSRNNLGIQRKRTGSSRTGLVCRCGMGRRCSTCSVVRRRSHLSSVPLPRSRNWQK